MVGNRRPSFDKPLPFGALSKGFGLVIGTALLFSLGNGLLWIILSLIGFSAVDFFFSGSTGALLGAAHRSASFWLALALAFGLVWYSWRRYRSTFSPFEFVLQVGVLYLSTLVATTILLAGAYDVKSLQVASAPLFSADYREPYTVQGEKGPILVAARYDVRYGDDGFWHDRIDAQQYQALLSYCGSAALQESAAEDGQISQGDGRLWRTDCRHTHFPVVQLWQSRDYIQGSRLSILKAQGQLSAAQSLAKELGLTATPYPSYQESLYGASVFPRIFDFTDRLSEAEKTAADWTLGQVSLASSQQDQPVNPMLLVFATDADPEQVADALTVAWKAPKVVDVLVLVNLSPTGQTIRWVEVRAPSDDITELATLGHSIATNGPFRADAAALTIADQLVNADGYRLITFSQPEDYAYVATSFGLSWSQTLLLLAVVLGVNFLTIRFFIWFNPILGIKKTFNIGKDA